jgi:membrane protein YdbS with pleckstrin-like domain
VHRIQLGGVLMVIAGVIVLTLLASFIFMVIVLLLELLAVMIGIVLVLGGIAAIAVGPKWWKRRRWDWETQTQST